MTLVLAVIVSYVLVYALQNHQFREAVFGIAVLLLIYSILFSRSPLVS